LLVLGEAKSKKAFKGGDRSEKEKSLCGESTSKVDVGEKLISSSRYGHQKYEGEDKDTMRVALRSSNTR